MANIRNNHFGDKLRDLRNDRKLSQYKLSRKIGVGKSIISLWECGKCDITLTKLISVAEFFGVSVDWLAGTDK